VVTRSKFVRLFLLAAALALTEPVLAQRQPFTKESFSSLSAATATYCLARHDVGRLVLGITNYGRIGIGRGRIRVDCFTGTSVPLGEYPKGSNTTYLYLGGLWIGGVVGKDTLVTTGADFNNESQEMHPVADMMARSILQPESPEYEQAVSEQDYIAVYVDTFTSGVPNPSFDPIDSRGHKPLNLEVTQCSYAWSYGHADDFILVDYHIKNIGDRQLTDVYVGLYWDADVHVGQRNVNIVPDPYGGKGITDGKDDLTGFLFTFPSQVKSCNFLDTVAIAWTADNNGDYQSGEFQVPAVIGTCFLGSVVDERKLSYNWWTFNYNAVYDFGPQKKENYRFMGNGLGTPYGDKNKYALLSNGEIDYDQVYTQAIGASHPIWLYPSPRISSLISKGIDVQYLLSIGPFTMDPGGMVTVPVALVAGSDFHTDPNNYNNNLRWNYDPEAFSERVDFSDLVRNALTAKRVYDIPGFDSNDDGYKGKFHVCVLDSHFVDGQWVPSAAETTYYEGDGIPDWRAAAPPPSPDFWLYPTLFGLRVRFNGARSETTRDVFSNKLDFEGYRIYIARDDRETSFSLVAQYDRENYDKYVYMTLGGKDPRFRQVDDPFTLEELRCLYGLGPDPCLDSTFDPLLFTPLHPYVHSDFPDSVFYFETHDYNQFEYGISTPITKIYPNEPPPASLVDVGPDQLTEDGYLKYYEYECYIKDLLPTVPYYVVVTAFDFGSPQAGLAPLETSKTLNAKSAYPNNELDQAPDDVKNVYVYPNPYREDAGYRVLGYEGLGQEDWPRDRVRKVTFANLPPKCTIKIFSLDGDLIREIKHDFAPSDPNSSYHEWDLVSRNVQMVVSGLYYWVVEDDRGRTQIGKLVILM
jgi:hypothetical protein